MLAHAKAWDMSCTTNRKNIFWPDQPATAPETQSIAWVDGIPSPVTAPMAFTALSFVNFPMCYTRTNVVRGRGTRKDKVGKPYVHAMALGLVPTPSGRPVISVETVDRMLLTRIVVKMLVHY